MRIKAFLEHSPMFCIHSTARRFEVLAARLLEADGLSFFEALVLATLFFEAPAAVKPSQLAEVFGTSRGNVSHYVSSLEAKGMVRRKIDPEDARAYHLALRPEGRRAAMRVIGALDKLQRRFEAELGKETLQSTLRVVQALGEIELVHGPRRVKR